MRPITPNQIWDDLRPRIVSLIEERAGVRTVSSGGSTGGGTTAAHDLSGALHLGTLHNNQAPQFLLMDGTRDLTGNMAVNSGVTIDGVDLSAHAANPDAHHAQAHVLATAVALGPDHTVSGLTGGHVLRATTATTARFSELQHSDLGGVTSDQHHAKLHAMLDTAHHSYSGGSALDVFGLSAASTLAKLTPSYDVSAGTSAILRSLSGALGLSQLSTPLINAPVSMTVEPVVNLDLSPGNDVLLNPVGDVVLGDGLTFRTNSFSTFYPIEGMIAAETSVEGQYGLAIGVIETDELRARVFVADEVRIDRGEEVWSKSYGITAADFTTPSSIGGTVTVTFESSPMVFGALFSTNDWLLFRTIDRDSGVVLSSVWGQVSGYTATNLIQFWTDFMPDDGMPDNSFPKVDLGTTTQDWTFTLRSGDTNYRIAKGALGIDYGASGQSYIAFSVTDPIAAPFIRIRRWTGANPYTPANHDDTVYIGNLNGIANAVGDRGIWTQNAAGTSWAELSDSGVALRNASIALYAGATQKVNIGASGTDFWMGTSSSDKRLYWNGTTLAITGQITVSSGSSGYANITDKPTSLADINASERYKLTAVSSAVFFESWDDDNALARWTNYSGSGELSITSVSDSVAGGKVLRVGNNSGNDQAWLICNVNIPFDSSKTYRIRARVRRNNGTGKVYLGLAGVAADGTTLVNVTGSNSHASQHYHAAAGAEASSDWTEYVGYTRGYGSPNGTSGVSTAASPGVAHNTVRYVRPLILVNHSGVAGQTDVDMFSIEAVSAAWYNIDSLPTRFGNEPTIAGLYMTPTHLGYYNGSAWKAWIASTGQFYFGGSTGAHIEWDGTYLKGVNSSSDVEWQASSTDGLFYAGGAILGDTGLTFDGDIDPISDISWVYGATENGYIRGSYDLSDWLGLEIYSSSAILIDAEGGVDITDGDLTVSDGVYATTLTGNSLNLTVISAPAAPASGGILYVDVADGDLKVKFANGTVKTIETN